MSTETVQVQTVKKSKPTTVQEYDALLKYVQDIYKFDLTNTKDIALQKLIPSKSKFSAKQIKKALGKKTEGSEETEEVSESSESSETKEKTKRGPNSYHKWVTEYKSIHGNDIKKDVLLAEWAKLSVDEKKAYKDKDVSGLVVEKKVPVKKPLKNANDPAYIFSEVAKRWIPRSGTKGKELVKIENQKNGIVDDDVDDDVKTEAEEEDDE